MDYKRRVLWLSALIPLIWDSAPAKELDTRIRLHSRGFSTYYVEGHIEGHGGIDLLVDTGSGYTVINEQTLAALKQKGLAKHVRGVSATMADGAQAVVPIYVVSSLEIGGSCVLHNVEVAVLPGATRCILGMATLKKLAPFMVSVEPSASLSVSHCEKPVTNSAVGAIR